MRIVVCIKIVPELQDMRIDKETNTLIRENVRQVINPADNTALETAVSMKNKWGGNVCVVSMGTEKAGSVLHYAAAGGADELYLISDKKFAGSDTYATATILAAAIKHLGDYDLILCGRRAVDGETGQVGPELSVMLDVPCLTNIVDIQKISDDAVLCTRLVEDGFEETELMLPALITVCEGKNLTCVPSISGLRRAKNIPLIRLSNTELKLDPSSVGLKGSLTRVKRVFSYFGAGRKCIKTTDSVNDKFI